MKNFTFVIITYNHEKYVLEQLESIKYQIYHYGKNYNVKLLVCDDCSTDNTINIIKKWVERNNFFGDVKYIISDVNRGTVANYLTAMENIDTDNFKESAGDDLYYKNNVFDVLNGDSNLVVTPIIRIDGRKAITKDLKREYYSYILTKNKRFLKKKMRYLIKNTTPFHTPGVFWDHRLLNEEIRNKMRKYKIIEDIPLFYNLLFLSETSVSYQNKCYVLYRISDGVSHNKNNNGRTQYEIEHDKLYDDYWISNKNILLKTIFRIVIKIYESFYIKFENVKECNSDYRNETENVNDYYNMIRNNVSLYLNEK